jgi:ADP-ribose pyrophosphatase YjhB (NUDIX family)
MDIKDKWFQWASQLQSIAQAGLTFGRVWSLPGSWADVNTTVSESAVRECLEEAGAIVNPKRIIAIQLANKHNNPLFLYTIYKVFVECELVDDSFKENTETLEAGFFDYTTCLNYRLTGIHPTR